MAVTKLVYATDASTWTVASVCNNLQAAFIGGGLMTAWYDSFLSGGYEHRVLEVVYNGAKTYGKTYYHFAISGSGIWLKTSVGWNATTHIPCGAGGTAGTLYVDFATSDPTSVTGSNAYNLIALNATVSFSITRYTSTGSRNFFVLRTGSTYHVFTIDPAGTTFRSFYDLNLGYHSGYFGPTLSNVRGIDFFAAHRTRRELFLGSCLNTSVSGFAQVARVSTYSIPQSAPGAGGNQLPSSTTSGFQLPGWSTVNPSAGSGFNPIFTGIRLTSIHNTDLPADFGIGTIKTSDNVYVQDNATVTAGVEEYEVLIFGNYGFTGSPSVTSNPVFLARIV